MARPQGALIVGCHPRWSAAKAGLKAGDVVLAMNNVADRACRCARLPAGHPGDRQPRRGSPCCAAAGEKTVRVTLERAPEGASTAESRSAGAAPSPAPRWRRCRRAWRSASACRRTRQASRSSTSRRNSPAAELGLRPRDIVREVNGERDHLRREAARMSQRSGPAGGVSRSSATGGCSARCCATDGGPVFQRHARRKPPAGRPLADRLRPSALTKWSARST